MLHSACLALAALAATSTLTIGIAFAQNPETARVRTGVITAPPTAGANVAYATTSFNCTNRNGSITTYTLSVDGGSCTTQGNTPTSAPNAGACRNNGTGDSVSANCGTGCGDSHGSGSCTQTTTRRLR